MADDPTQAEDSFVLYQPHLYDAYREPPPRDLIPPEPSNAELRAIDPSTTNWPVLLKLVAALIVAVVAVLLVFPPHTWTFG